MATIHQLPSGSWLAQIRLKGHPRSSKAFSSKEQAKTWADQQEAAYKLNKLTEVNQWPTVEQLGISYAETKLKGKPSHWKALLVAKQLGVAFPLPINALTSKMVNDFKLKRLAEVKTETCRGQLSFLSRFYRFAQRELLLEIDNPVARIVMPAASKPSDKVVTKSELDRLLSQLSPTMALIVEVAYETAMRRSEIVKLTPAHLHLEERIADVIDGKNGTRNVPLTHRAVELLQAALKRSNVRFRENYRLFPVTPHAVSTAVRRARKLAGLDDCVRLHQLRHTRITNVAKKGFNNAQIMVVSGHRDTRSVARYSHLNAKDVLHLLD